jgi:hypothetical protein
MDEKLARKGEKCRKEPGTLVQALFETKNREP